MLTEPSFEHWRREAVAQGCASSVALPLMSSGRPFGSITVYSRDPDPFSDDEVELLSELADDLARGITAIRLSRENARAQEALRHSEERYRSLVELSPEAIMINREDRFVFFNPAALRLLGAVDSKELLGKKPFDVFCPEFHELIRERLNTVRQGRSVPLIEEKILRLDGEIRAVEVAAAPFDDFEGRAIQVIAHDITERKRAEEELRRSEERYRLLFEAMTEGFALLEIVHDAAGQVCDYRLLDVNPAFERLTGLSRNQVIGKLQSELVHGEDSHWMGIYSQLSQSDEPMYFEYYSTLLQRHFEVYAYSPMQDQYAVLFTDVTERRRMEQVLAERQALLDAVCEGSQDAIYIKDRESRLLLANPAVVALVGKPLEQIVGHRDDEFFDDPAIGAAILENDRRIMANGPETVEEIIDTPAGRRVMLSTKSPWRDARGEVVGILGISRDITVRKEEEERLRRQAEEIEKMMDLTPVAIWVAHDPECRRITGNRMGNAFYEAESGDNVSAWPPPGEPPSPRRFFRNGRELAPEELPMQYAALNGVEVRNSELEVLLPSGSRIHMIGSASPLRDSEGRVRGCLAAFLNITERKSFEEALQMAKEAAEEANKAKDRFLAVLSHELRTPLTPVLAAVSMLQRESGHTQQTQVTLEMMRRNVEMEARLIDDLLDLTRIARGKTELDKRPVELSTIIQRAVEVCLPDVNTRRLDLTVDVSGAPYPVEADAARLQQVFWNLIRNAVKFTQPGGRVSIRCVREGDDKVVVEVSDNGEGIAPETLPRLFEAFEQGEPGTTRQFGGLGLGLAISRSLVELHGGTIEAQSEGKGKGSTFRVRLPLAAAAALGESSRNGQSSTQTPEPAAPSLSILYVEDHGDTAELMRDLLEMEGHRVQTAGDMATAFDMASHQNFDLLISDLGLPDGSGIDLMRQLRESGNTVPGIALSGYGQEQDVRQSLDAGFSMHIVKPVGIDHLLDALAQVAPVPRPATMSDGPT